MQVPITIDECDLVNALTEPLSEVLLSAMSDGITEAACEAGSDAGSDAGRESGWDAGRDAAQEVASENGSDMTWDSILGRLDGEFTGRSYGSGCGEWRSVYHAIDWAVAESIRVEDGTLHFLDAQSRGVATTAEVPDGGGGLVGQALNQRVQDLELLVAGLAQALSECITSDSITPLRTYAATARAHQWPEWMASVNVTT